MGNTPALDKTPTLNELIFLLQKLSFCDPFLTHFWAKQKFWNFLKNLPFLINHVNPIYFNFKAHAMCEFVIFGPLKRAYIVKEPLRASSTPQDLFCPYCRSSGKPIYRQMVVSFCILNIPVYTIRREEPFLSCFNCEINLGTEGVGFCSRCRTISPGQYIFCVYCGLDIVAVGAKWRLI